MKTFQEIKDPFVTVNEFDEYVVKLARHIYAKTTYEILNSKDPLGEAQNILQKTIDAPSDLTHLKEYLSLKTAIEIDCELIRDCIIDIFKGEEKELLDGVADNIPAELIIAKALALQLLELENMLTELKKGFDEQKLAEILGVPYPSKEEASKMFSNMNSYRERFKSLMMADLQSRIPSTTVYGNTDILAEDYYTFNVTFSRQSSDTDIRRLENRLRVVDPTQEYGVDEYIQAAVDLKSGDLIKVVASFNHRKQVLFARLMAIEDYLEYLKIGLAESSVDDSNIGLKHEMQDKPEFDPCQKNLALMSKYHGRLKELHELLKDDFFICSYEIFEGIFKPDCFRGPIRLAAHTTLLELHEFVSRIKGSLNSEMSIMKTSSVCFVYNDGESINYESLRKPSGELNPKRKRLIECAALILKGG